MTSEWFIQKMFMKKRILNWDGMEYLIFGQTSFWARMNLTSKPTNGPMYLKHSREKMRVWGWCIFPRQKITINNPSRLWVTWIKPTPVRPEKEGQWGDWKVSHWSHHRYPKKQWRVWKTPVKALQDHCFTHSCGLRSPGLEQKLGRLDPSKSNPIFQWMITRGTPTYGNPQMEAILWKHTQVTSTIPALLCCPTQLLTAPQVQLFFQSLSPDLVLFPRKVWCPKGFSGQMRWFREYIWGCP